jgi:hypothetical protein
MTRRLRRKATRARSWSVFERRFRPINRQDGTPLWELSEVRPADVSDLRHWWTVIDCDGGLYLSAGFRFVNRLAYVRCEAPWTGADEVIDYRYD